MRSAEKWNLPKPSLIKDIVSTVYIARRVCRSVNETRRTHTGIVELVPANFITTNDEGKRDDFTDTFRDFSCLVADHFERAGA